MFNIKKKSLKNFDYLLFLITLSICIFGLVVLNSAVSSLSGTYIRNQVIATILGFVVILVLMFLDIDFLKKLQWPFYIISVVLLALTLKFGHGDSSGARAWLKIGVFSFQPSEFVKIMMTISVASFIDKRKATISRPLTLLQILIYAGIPILLVFKQPDLGTAMVMAFMLVIMLFVAGLDIKYFLGTLVLAVIGAPLAYTHLDDFQKNRIINFLDPSNTDSSNDQMRYGRIAIGSGGLNGRGYKKGPLSQNGFVPEVHTDFIFAILVEELGFIGGTALILLYALLIWRMLKIAKNTNSTFSALIVMGFTAMIFVHIFENIGMTIGLMPVTGIPLPLMSYGGTFQLVVLVAIGISLSVGVQRQQLDFSYKINE